MKKDEEEEEEGGGGMNTQSCYKADQMNCCKEELRHNRI